MFVNRVYGKSQINDLETMGGVVTFNPEIYQDGTISEESLDVLRSVKAAVRP